MTSDVFYGIFYGTAILLVTRTVKIMPKVVKSLTDTQVRLAKPREKNYKISDGNGMYLLVKVDGSKHWRLDYTRPILQKRNTLAFGGYPDVSLSEARAKRDHARKLLASGVDPSDQRKAEIRETKLASNNTFEFVALEWLEKQAYQPSTLKAARYLFEIPFQQFGNKPIAEITPIEVLEACRIAEKQGNLEKARKMRIKCGQVFRYGVATTVCVSDPTRDLKGALKAPTTQHLAAIIDPNELKLLLDDIEHYQGRGRTIYALKLAPILFVRPGELRTMRWDQLNLDEAQWSYIPPKTKRTSRVEMVIPLPSQCVEILRQVKVIADSKGSLSEYVFPCQSSSLKPMSENTINQALRRLGWETDQVCGHGFRATARTILEEVLEYPAELIEMQLGHRVSDPNGRAYNRTWKLKPRAEMMQAWADYLHQLRINK